MRPTTDGSTQAGLPAVPMHQVDQFVVHGLGFRRAGLDGVRRTMLEVVPHQLAADGAQGFMDRGNLCEDVCTITVILDHFLEPAHLAFDSSKPFEVPRLELRVDRDGTPPSRPTATHIRALFNRRLLVTTLTELNAIAALARIGLSRMP